jgi:hypothetical protein
MDVFKVRLSTSGLSCVRSKTSAAFESVPWTSMLSVVPSSATIVGGTNSNGAMLPLTATARVADLSDNSGCDTSASAGSVWTLVQNRREATNRKGTSPRPRQIMETPTVSSEAECLHDVPISEDDQRNYSGERLEGHTPNLYRQLCGYP